VNVEIDVAAGRVVRHGDIERAARHPLLVCAHDRQILHPRHHWSEMDVRGGDHTAPRSASFSSGQGWRTYDMRFSTARQARASALIETGVGMVRASALPAQTEVETAQCRRLPDHWAADGLDGP